MAGKDFRRSYHINGLGQITLEIPALNLAELNRMAETMAPLVKRSASQTAAQMQVNAPKRSGNLARGIIVSPEPERTSDPAKVVYDIYFDAGMNDKFVKVSKAGKRYYYPASQEYGFRTVNGGRVPGKYYMRDTAVAFSGEHQRLMAAGVEDILEESS